MSARRAAAPVSARKSLSSGEFLRKNADFSFFFSKISKKRIFNLTLQQKRVIIYNTSTKVIEDAIAFRPTNRKLLLQLAQAQNCHGHHIPTIRAYQNGENTYYAATC